MANAVEELRRMTIAEFDAFTAGLVDDREFELVDGEFAMMVNPTDPPAQIASNIAAHPEPRLS
jgi:hypothetical protein